MTPRFLIRLVALRTARDAYVAVAILVLHGSSWLDRHRIF